MQTLFKLPKLFRKALKKSMKEAWKKAQLDCASKVVEKEFGELIDFSKEVKLVNFHSRNGNVSPHELLYIAALIAHYRPKRILEIGTFDGNTTLQMAINAPEDALIYTVDLPQNKEKTELPTLKEDFRFIQDSKKWERKFYHRTEKVKEYFGDSTQLDFSLFTSRGLLDFIFVDGGHSYECVSSDSAKALEVVAPGGVILWHDYTPLFEGVYRHLNELSQRIPLIHIKDTNLVLYHNPKMNN